MTGIGVQSMAGSSAAQHPPLAAGRTTSAGRSRPVRQADRGGLAVRRAPSRPRSPGPSREDLRSSARPGAGSLLFGRKAEVEEPRTPELGHGLIAPLRTNPEGASEDSGPEKGNARSADVYSLRKLSPEDLCGHRGKERRPPGLPGSLFVEAESVISTACGGSRGSGPEARRLRGPKGRSVPRTWCCYLQRSAPCWGGPQPEPSN